MNDILFRTKNDFQLWSIISIIHVSLQNSMNGKLKQNKAKNGLTSLKHEKKHPPVRTLLNTVSHRVLENRFFKSQVVMLKEKW